MESKMSRNQLLISAAVAALSILGAAVFLGSKDAEAGPPKQPERSDIEAGAVLYTENCASCHGAKLEGEPDWRSPKDDGTLPAPPHDRTGHTWHHGDALLFNYTKLGGQAALAASGVTNFNSGMPGFAEQLSDQEIWDILAFIKSTWPDRMRETQEVRTKGEQIQGGS
ncbi:cytochrome c [Shimia thalassica]|uniref:c-type cytochrome n=1 Tax=Shimia thalassica TaxID=1715693 RepID=UPI002735D300|nr:cytochrome c [Shimia thalassica]MDP2520614.1 cytochrome c [Shimia thalassica]MDP2582010.1 cytochrome c [Shimia thalassica]